MKPLDIKQLLPELRKLLAELSEDLLERVNAETKINEGLKEAFSQIEKGGRTAQAYEVWLEDYLDQVAVAWILACVFVRFMEDNDLIDECWLAGEGERRTMADDAHTLYFREHRGETEREYFEHVFREVRTIPAAAELFAEGKTPLWAVAPSGVATRKLLKFWREMNAESGHLKRSFFVENSDTRFLGDLYQELSERAKKKYALLQTPLFVEEFILDRTLTPAIDEFGLEQVRMIDPTCGSGHFLLGGFGRLFALWSRPEHTTGNADKDAQKALDGVWGVDINPFAVAIARFRLIVAAAQACGVNRLKQAPGWTVHLASGDSLLFGSKPGLSGKRIPIVHQKSFFEVPAHYATEDCEALQRILGQGYHVVAGNPPYIIMRDRAQNAAYRELYSACGGKYSLSVPFTQRFWELALPSNEPHSGSGYVGLITTNSFMKREFGKKLIEQFFPRIDLTHVLDTSGAYIPGHGTPTVILFGRAQKPVGTTVRAVLGITGEPSTPDNPSQGLVWQSIMKHIDSAGSRDAYTSTADVPRATLAQHPWSIGGGGAAELKEQLDEASETTVDSLVSSIGFASFPGLDDAFVMDLQSLKRKSVPEEFIKSFIVGECVRDWLINPGECALAPYDAEFRLVKLDGSALWVRHLWNYRACLESIVSFAGQTRKQLGDSWWGWYRWIPEKYKIRKSISFSEVATHNHFVLDRGGHTFKNSAPVIKFAADTADDMYYRLLGILNSSTACFWLKQVCHNKGSSVDQHGARQRTAPFEDFYAFNGTRVGQLPIPEFSANKITKHLDTIGQKLFCTLPDCVLKADTPTTECFSSARSNAMSLRGQMITLQEELDWHCYQCYGLLSDDLGYSDDDLPELALGERAFEIFIARQIATGKLETTWFARHESKPITEIPIHWPVAYRKLVQRRIEVIEINKDIALIEKPEFKRRWNDEPWEEQEHRALKDWLLKRLETSKYQKGTRQSPELTTTAQIADVASADAEFQQVAAMYRGRTDFDLVALIAELVEGEAVPFLPILRYKPSGLRKRELWERTWELQRKEDQLTEELAKLQLNQSEQGRQQIEALGGSEEDFQAYVQDETRSLQKQIETLASSIAVPPKYATADFQKTDYWRLRGKLDVPKERWISFPHCSTEGDPSLVVGWAGWNHLQQATAIVAYYDSRKREGWTAEQLMPLLTGLDQLIPWVHQWHPEIDPEYGETAGQSFERLLEADAHELGLILDVIRSWKPPEKVRKATATGKKKAVAEVKE